MKKFLKPVISLTLAASLSLGSLLPALAYEPEDARVKADVLNALELFQGTENGYELDKPLTRMEALIMLIRLSGKELDALYLGDYSHPFTDAPDWEDAGKYLGYAYENGLTAGVSATEFAPENRADLQMYITFVLRALGYKDTSDALVWDNWEALAKEAGLLDGNIDRENFLRGDAVVVSHAALDAEMQNLQDTEAVLTLKEKLAEEGAFNELSLAIANVIGGKQVTADSPLTEILGKVYLNSGLSLKSFMLMPLDETNLSFFLGVDANTLPFEEGLACEPMMSSVPHSVCLVRVKEGTDIEQAKKDIAEHVNPRKWICVGVSPANVRVENIGNLILLVMDNSNPDGLVRNFRELNPNLVAADENGMLAVDGSYIAADESVNAASVNRFVDKLNTLRESYFADNEVYYATIPEKSYFVRDSVLDFLNHDVISGLLAEELYDWKSIELGDVLSLDDYYTTDRHWRQEKLFPVVEKLGEVMNFSVSTDGFEQHTAQGFVGAYKDMMSGLDAEALVWLTGEYTESAVVDNFQNSSFTAVYEEEKLDSKTPYDIFLSGATPLTVIENPNAAEKRELVIFRDSYGSSLAPLLIEAYSKITLVDLRYMASSLLPDYVDFTDAEVLFLLSDKVVNNSTMLK